MNSLLLAVGLQTCIAYAGWVGYYYNMRWRSNVAVPKSWMIDGIPQFEPVIDKAFEYPENLSKGFVEIDSQDYCESKGERS